MGANEFTDQYGDWVDPSPDPPIARWLDVTLAELGPQPMLLVSPQMTIEQVVRLMNEQRESAALVVQDDALLGMFTERDLLQHVLPSRASLQRPVSEVMSVRPHALTESTSLTCAVRELAQGPQPYLPVLDALGRPVALLSARSIVGFLVATFPNEILHRALEHDNACERASGGWRDTLGDEQSEFRGLRPK